MCSRDIHSHTHTFARSHLVLLTVTVGPYAAAGLRRLQHPVRVIGAILEANRPMLERPLLSKRSKTAQCMRSVHVVARAPTGGAGA